MFFLPLKMGSLRNYACKFDELPEGIPVRDAESHGQEIHCIATLTSSVVIKTPVLAEDCEAGVAIFAGGRPARASGLARKGKDYPKCGNTKPLLGDFERRIAGRTHNGACAAVKRRYPAIT